MTRRLLHVAHYSPDGSRSFDHYLLGLARHVVSKGWEVRHVYGGEPAASYAREMTALGIPYHVVPMPFTMASRREMNRKLGGYRPTVTLTNFLSAFSPAVLAMKVRGDTPRLVVRDNSSGTARPGGLLRRVLRKARGRLVGRVVDGLIPVSEYVARRNVEVMGMPPAKVHTVLNGIDANYYPFGERTPGPALRVAFVGQLIPEKGLDTLLAALAKLSGAGVPVEVRVAGRGPAEAGFQAQAAALNLGVKFLGHFHSVPELMAWAEVVVVPSRWAEAFGLVAAEAMATGAAVVVSDAGALPEVVGDAGRVFPAGDAAALAHVLRQLAADPAERRRLGQAGRNRVAEEFRLVDAIAGVYEVLDRVTAEYRPAAVTPSGVPPCPNDSSLVASGLAEELQSSSPSRSR